MGGVYGCSETIEIQVVMGIDKATHVRERQSGTFVRGGHDTQRWLCKQTSSEKHRQTLCVCGEWSDIKLTLQFNDKALLAVSVPL